MRRAGECLYSGEGTPPRSDCRKRVGVLGMLTGGVVIGSGVGARAFGVLPAEAVRALRSGDKNMVWRRTGERLGEREASRRCRVASSANCPYISVISIAERSASLSRVVSCDASSGTYAAVRSMVCVESSSADTSSLAAV